MDLAIQCSSTGSGALARAGGDLLIPTGIDYSQDFGPSDHDLWDSEHDANVRAVEWLPGKPNAEQHFGDHDLGDYALPYDFIDEFERMEPEEPQFILDELAERPELWDEKEVMIL